MIDVLQKLLAFAVTLGLLITFHELGHYFVARLAGVKVLRFSIGFGRVVWSRRVGPDATEWAISAVPLGGYVKMVDEREGEIEPGDRPRAFNRQSVWKDVTLELLLKHRAGVPGQRAVLAAPPEASAAATAGLATGDVVTAGDGSPIRSWQDLRWQLLHASGSDTVKLTVERPGGARTERTLSLAALNAGEWEGNFLGALGLKLDLGVPLVRDVVPGKPAAVAGLKAGDAILSIDGEPMRSPSDVATVTNAHPGEGLRFKLRRDGGEFEVALTPEPTEQNGRKVGIAAMRLAVDPAAAADLAVTVRYAPAEALTQAAVRT